MTTDNTKTPETTQTPAFVTPEAQAIFAFFESQHPSAKVTIREDDQYSSVIFSYNFGYPTKSNQSFYWYAHSDKAITWQWFAAEYAEARFEEAKENYSY